MKYASRLGPGAKLLLQRIAEHPQGISTEDCKKLGIFQQPPRCVIALDHLCDMGLIQLDKTGRLWTVTADGLSSTAGRKTTSKRAPIEDAKPMVVLPRRVEFTGVYMGEELRPQTARPAGNLAAQLPSRISGMRVAARRVN